MQAKDRILVALDVPTVEKAAQLVNMLSGLVGGFKIGMQLINEMLASLVSPQLSEEEAVKNLGEARGLFQLVRQSAFWDQKPNDIEPTVAGAIAPIVGMGVKMINVHASAGKKALQAAVQHRGSAKLLGVTVLTSIGLNECLSIFGDTPGRKVMQFAQLLAEVGADGIICSPQELEFLRQDPTLSRLLRVIPGIRPEWAQIGAQSRVMTPGEAVRAGADYLVIGTPITKPPPELGSPLKAVERITDEIEAAFTATAQKGESSV